MMAFDTDLFHKKIIAFLRMSETEKATAIDSSQLFPSLPHDTGSRDVLDLEKNVMLCIAVDLDDYCIDAMMGEADADSEAERRLCAIRAYLRYMVNDTYRVLHSQKRLLSFWTRQGLGEDEWLGLSILSAEIFSEDPQIKESLMSDGDSLFHHFVPDSGSLAFE